MEEYVTVVSVDEATNKAPKTIDVTDHQSPLEDSSFVTVLSINNDPSARKPHQQNSTNTIEVNGDHQNPIEQVVVYRLPGERLGFGLKFQGGITKSDEKNGSQTVKKNEKVQRLFIQSCAVDSPASRAKASWGHLKEGDEIISIDGQPVAEMTRIECVRCLKESNVAIKLEVRNGDGLHMDSFEDENGKNHTHQQPPPPPPVPPRKLIKRKQVYEKANPRDDKPFTPPPDAEYYINLFSDENGILGECESDDTGSSISTVVDRFSICSTYSTESDYSYTSNGSANPIISTSTTSTSNQIMNKADLAKVLKPFTLLEKEFNVDSSARLEECLKKIDPDMKNLAVEMPKQTGSAYENVLVVSNVQTTKITESNGHEESDDQSHVYENIEIVTIEAPKPKPRQAAIEPKKRSVLPVPRKVKEEEKDKESNETTDVAVSDASTEVIETLQTGKPQEIISKIPKATPPKQFQRAKTEGEIKFNIKASIAFAPYMANIIEHCQIFLHNEAGRPSLPKGVTIEESKTPKSKIPVARLEKLNMHVSPDSANNETSKTSEKSLILQPKISFKKQKSETDLKLGSPHAFLKEAVTRNDANQTTIVSPSKEKPSKIVQKIPSPPQNRSDLTLNLSSNIPVHKGKTESKINFSIAPMAQSPNGLDAFSVMTPIRTKSQIPVLSPDANECSFKTFSKDSEKRHLILNIAPDKERKILNITTPQTVTKVAKEVPPPVVPKAHADSYPDKSQTVAKNLAQPVQPKIKFTLQTYEGDKLDTNLKMNDLNNPLQNHNGQTKIPQMVLQHDFDENGNEKKPILEVDQLVVGKSEKGPESETKEMESFGLDKSEEDSKDEFLDDQEEPLIIGRCIKLMNNDDTGYILSSSSSSDEDEEKVYEIEDGEKLGPPEVVDGPGPSEAYFNFSWHSNMLPTIGEVEEEYSSLEIQTRALADTSLAATSRPCKKNDDTVPYSTNQDEIDDFNEKEHLADVKLEVDKMTPMLTTAGSIKTVESTIPPPPEATTAVTENENSSEMTLRIVTDDEENKLAASDGRSDKITTVVENEINEISNKSPQSSTESIVQKKISIESCTVANQRKDSNSGADDGEAVAEQLKMSTNTNETNETSKNATNLMDLSTDTEDPLETVLDASVKMTSENFESKDSSPLENSTSTGSTSPEFLGDVSASGREDHSSKIEKESENSDKSENVQKDITENSDIKLIEESDIDNDTEQRNEPTFDEPPKPTVEEPLESAKQSEPSVSTSDSKEIVSDAKETVSDTKETVSGTKGIVSDTDHAPEVLVASAQPLESNSSCDKTGTTTIEPLSGNQLIEMTQAMLNSERAISKGNASMPNKSRMDSADSVEEQNNSSNENKSVTQSTAVSTDTEKFPKIIDTVPKPENDLKSEFSVENESELLNHENSLPSIDCENAPISLPNIAFAVTQNKTEAVEEENNETEIEEGEEKENTENTLILSKETNSELTNGDTKKNVAETPTKITPNRIQNGDKNIKDTIEDCTTLSKSQKECQNSKPIERIILGVENDQDSSTDVTTVKRTTSASSTDTYSSPVTIGQHYEPKNKTTSQRQQSDSTDIPSEKPRKLSGSRYLESKPAILPKPVNIKDSNLIKMDKSGIQIAPSPIILNDYISLSSPPTYSRLPPDGHEFPPNFSEPMIIPVKTTTASTTDSKVIKQGNIFSEQQLNSNTKSDCPPLPKSTPPPTVPRKVYRQDLIIKVDDARPVADKNEKIIRLDQGSSFTTSSTNSPLTPTTSSPLESSRSKSSSISALHNMDSYKSRPSPTARKLSDWRKDEKSEKSVRDKIAMFSTNEDRSPELNRSTSKPFNKSIENLLDSSVKLTPYTSSLTKRAMSVENLTDDYRPYSRSNSGFVERNKPESTLYKSEITQSYSSLPRRNIPTLTRTTSFSGHDEGSRRASIANILEQRRRSMSKLRGLVIPERPSSNLETIIDLPEIKSKDSEKIKMNGYSTLQATPRKDRYPHSARSTSVTSSPNLSNGVYKSIFSSGHRMGSTPATQTTPTSSIYKKSESLSLPPAKPPRTSLILSKASPVEESDSDSVFSSKISSPPMSPRAPVQEKFALTRTLSSETNTSIASSTTSTLTSGSGSQASCSSVGSTPTVDMSRKILKSGSGDSTVNRKNILASAKCRSGRDDSSSLVRSRRYEDEDSTDGYDEEETRRAPKLKQRSTSTGSAKSSVPSAPINYKLVGKDESLVDKIVNVASYVEITSDTDDSSRKSDSSLRKISAIFIDEERKASFKADPNQKPRTKKPEPAKRSAPVPESDDLAKWVQSEAAKAFRQKDASPYKPAPPERSGLAEKFESKHKTSAENSARTPLKLKTSTAEIREKFEMRSQSAQSPVKPITPISSKPEKTFATSTYHERFSSLDSIASSSSGVSSSAQNLPSSQETPTEFGSFSSFGSNQSLITAQDIQVLIEEADPPLKTSDAFIVVLQRDSPESSIGITLAGGSDYEAKEITIHKILGNSPASKDGRLKKGDRILAINGLSMRGLTHRESITVLKTPRPEVVLVVTRSESVIVKPLSKKRSSLGSLTSLNDKQTEIDTERKIPYHKASRSLDLDLDIVSAKEILSDTKSPTVMITATTTKSSTIFDQDNMNGNLKSAEVLYQQQTITRNGGSTTTTSTGYSTNNKIYSSEILERVRENDRSIVAERQERVVINGDEVPPGAREIEIIKDNCGLGFSIEGGYDSPLGNRPLVVKKVFWGGAAQKAGCIKSGDEIVCINGVTTGRMTRVDVWNYMKQLPMGPVKIVLL